MSGLKVNFNKSNIYGTHVGEDFLEAASTFLSCKKDKLPFKFLGVKVGDNPRKLAMWKDLISLLKRRLAVWKGFNLNIAGRVCLINSVLNAIPIFSLSFYKVPAKILKEIRAIQAKFLWNGCDSRRPIHWVSWDTVCKTRDEGGLGVKNVEVMNVALLSKWKWRILVDDEAVWRDILVSRYGNIKLKALIGDVSVVNRGDSIWWRDILLSDNYISLLNHNFTGVVQCIVGNGADIPFWYGLWAGNQPLSSAFMELFVRANSDAVSVQQAGCHSEYGWCWMRAEFFGDCSNNNAAMWGEFFDYFQHCVPVDLSKDKFVWIGNDEGIFTVKSCYERFFSKLSGPPLNSVIVKSVKNLWKVKAPPKILFFGWRIIHNRLASKDQLFRRGILRDPSDLVCVFCSKEIESLLHLLGGCNFIARIWRKVFEWLGPVDNLSLEEYEGFIYMAETVKNKDKRTILMVIWLATVWGIWNRRNAIIFKKESFSFTECMSEIIHNSWVWLFSYYKVVDHCNFHVWSTLPLTCFVM